MNLKKIIFSLLGLCRFAMCQEMPPIEDCIPKALSNLAPPIAINFLSPISMNISAKSDEAKLHTLQGMNHLHGGWEFEAMRHFSHAMQKDPRCLMAHWGMLMSMLLPSEENNKASISTANRMLTLITEGEGNEQEKAYALGLIDFIQKGAHGAGETYQKISKKYPNDVQLEILTALFSRDGYDEQGKPRPNQRIAEEALLNRIKKTPNETAPLHALLSIRAEAFELQDTLELARKLCQLAPSYPPYFHVLGHYEWRCGNHQKAAYAFGRSAYLFSNWMRENSVSPSDCPGWVRAECYRIVSLASKGDIDNALASANKIANTKLDETRPHATGTRCLLWDAKTLPARVILRSSQTRASATALASLPKPEESRSYRNASLSHWWIDGLRIALEAQRLIDLKELRKASETIKALSFHGQSLSKLSTKANHLGEFNEWRNSLRSLEILTAELKGNLVLAGPKANYGSAFNWYRAATDRQKPQGMEKSPTILAPMALHLGDYFVINKNPIKAIEAFEEALKIFPNDNAALIKIENARKLVSQGQ